MQMYHESKNPHFSSIFFNMNISLFIALICLKTCMCIAEICMEEKVSQFFFIYGLVFVSCHIEKGILKENTKIHRTYPFFCHKIKTRT